METREQLLRRIAEAEKSVEHARLMLENAPWRMGPRRRSELDSERHRLGRLRAQLIELGEKT